MKQYSSIFNDVLGPVMCGPSSSHTACAVRIGRTLRQMLDGEIKTLIAEFEPKGSLATTYHSQGSDIGLVAGLLGMEPDDSRISRSIAIAKEMGIHMEFNIVEYPATHPNTYRMTLENKNGNKVHATALSVGGGMLEFTEVEIFPVLMTGGFYETLVFLTDIKDDEMSRIGKALKESLEEPGKIESQQKEGKGFFEITTEKIIKKEALLSVLKGYKVEKVMWIEPCLPIASQHEPKVPFHNGEELITYAEKQGYEIWQAAQKYESVRGNISEKETYEKMRNLVGIMKKSLEFGLTGTSYEKRILGCQSKYMSDVEKTNRLIPSEMVNEIIRCISAIMETKSSMGVFVAAPTAGSCGGLPGTVIGVARQLKLSDDQIIKAMFAAGIVGVFISEESTFAAEVAGCQAECGAGSGLTGAALVQLMNGTAKEALNAASMSLQNILGMACDPVAMAVEVPCLGKNIMCGLNAFCSANMALAGFNVVIPLDETIQAYDKVGRMIPSELRCTGAEGLSVTKSSKKIQKWLYE